MTTPTPPSTKAELRQWLAERRRSLQVGATDVRASAVAINAMELLRERVPAARKIGLFMSFGHEPPTDMLVAGLSDRGFTVLLPRVVEDSKLEWRSYNDTWTEDLLGITTPADSAVHYRLSDAQAIFIPALAASRDGRRLGRGAGYYDRALAEVPRFADGGPYRIAVVDAAGLLPDEVIPMEPHDAWVDAILIG